MATVLLSVALYTPDEAGEPLQHCEHDLGERGCVLLGLDGHAGLARLALFYGQPIAVGDRVDEVVGEALDLVVARVSHVLSATVIALQGVEVLEVADQDLFDVLTLDHAPLLLEGANFSPFWSRMTSFGPPQRLA